jgi:hypothetical protein
VEENGEVLFLDDIYEHDAALERVLAADTPIPTEEAMETKFCRALGLPAADAANIHMNEIGA